MEKMRKIATSLIVSMLVLGMLLVFSPRTEAQGNAPFWSVGNYWNYSGEVTMPPVTVNMTMKMYVNGTASVTVGLTSYMTWEVLAWSNMTMRMPPNPPMYMNGTGKSWLRTSDLATVMTNMSLTNPMPPPPVIMTETTYDPPQENFGFPLTDSDMWTSTSIVNETTNMGPPTSTTRAWYYNVSGPHSITISGLGTFSTFNITQQESGSATVTQSWYSDTVGNYVRMLIPSVPPLIVDLHDYSYVTNQPPTKPTIAYSPSTIYNDTTVTFNTASTDPDGDTISYAWEFGDGGTANTQQATHSYSSPGTFTVNVTASDGKGGTARNSTAVTVLANQPPSEPTMTITPSMIYRGTTVTFDTTSTDPDGDTISYAWEFGDGGTASTQEATHSYSSLGTFAVNVTAFDGKGGTASNSTTITVRNRAPGQITLTFDPASPEVGKNVTMTATATDADGDALTFTWKFGDGTTATGTTVHHAYASAGDFTVNVTVSDGHGGNSWIERTIAVKEKAADNTMLYIIIIIIVIVIIAIIAALVARSRKKSAMPPTEPPARPPPQ